MFKDDSNLRFDSPAQRIEYSSCMMIQKCISQSGLFSSFIQQNISSFYNCRKKIKLIQTVPDNIPVQVNIKLEVHLNVEMNNGIFLNRLNINNKYERQVSKDWDNFCFVEMAKKRRVLGEGEGTTEVAIISQTLHMYEASNAVYAQTNVWTLPITKKCCLFSRLAVHLLTKIGIWIVKASSAKLPRNQTDQKSYS